MRTDGTHFELNYEEYRKINCLLFNEDGSRVDEILDIYADCLRVYVNSTKEFADTIQELLS
jgi:hypothetical protein